MARTLRLEFPGAIYHVTVRGNERRTIFRADADRVRFLEKLAGKVEEHHIRLYAYVLMPNHFHLLLETPRANLSRFMQEFNTAYTVYFNRRHERTGHLFAGRYKARLVEGDPYLLRLTRYIHLNPVCTDAMREQSFEEKRRFLHAYRWSSYRSYVGIVRRESWVDYGPLMELVAAGSRDREQEYQQFVEAGLAQSDAELQTVMSRSSKAIGSEEFCRRAEESYRELAGSQGQVLDVAMRRRENPFPLETVISAICSHFQVTPEFLRLRRGTHVARLLAMKLLKEEAGLTQREIAVWLGLKDGSGVSRHLAVLNHMLESDEQLARTYRSIRKAIRG